MEEKEFEVQKVKTLQISEEGRNGLRLPTAETMKRVSELLEFVEAKGWSKSTFAMVVSELIPHFEFGVYYEKHVSQLTWQAGQYLDNLDRLRMLKFCEKSSKE